MANTVPGRDIGAQQSGSARYVQGIIDHLRALGLDVTLIAVSPAIDFVCRPISSLGVDLIGPAFRRIGNRVILTSPIAIARALAWKLAGIASRQVAQSASGVQNDVGFAAVVVWFWFACASRALGGRRPRSSPKSWTIRHDAAWMVRCLFGTSAVMRCARGCVGAPRGVPVRRRAHATGPMAQAREVGARRAWDVLDRVIFASGIGARTGWVLPQRLRRPVFPWAFSRVSWRLGRRW